MPGERLLRCLLAVLLWWEIRDPRRRASFGRLIMQLRHERERVVDASGPSGLVMLRPQALSGMDIDGLLACFTALAIAKDEADGIIAYERLHRQLDEVVRELKRREGDGRHALLPLYAHPDVRVRAEAADATRTLAPELARDRLLAIDDPQWSAPAGGERRRSRLQGMTAQQLVDRFVAIALDQDDALLKDRNARFNRLHGLMEAVEEELAARAGDQRRVLLALLEHPNPQVRLRAAAAVRAVAPDAARRALQRIVDDDEFPQAVDASGMLQSLGDGRHQPS